MLTATKDASVLAYQALRRVENPPLGLLYLISTKTERMAAS